MIQHHRLPIVLIILSLGLFACSAQNSEQVKDDSNRNRINVIALMPVENKTQDMKVPELLSVRLQEELRFKGYSQTIVPAGNAKDTAPAGAGEHPDSTFPQNIADVRGADAAMYCTLQESKISTVLFYAPATVSVRCELRSVKTGETIWNAQYRYTSRNFDVMNATLKSRGALESALDVVVDKVMETLPYGPMLRG